MSNLRKMVQVLLVDNHPIFLDGVRRTLDSSGDFKVAGEARSGESAVALACQLRPELMLLDLSLPDISGLEVLRRLGEAGHRLRVLILTANIDHTRTVEALQLGVRGVVLKDAGADLLLKSMRAVMAGQYWVGHKVMADFVDVLKRRPPASTITAREQQVIDLVLAGMSNREIGAKLSISQETVKRHLRNVFDKLGVSSRLELALRVTGRKSARQSSDQSSRD